MDEQIDDTERRIRLKELQLALLRGDITLAEHDRRRARYELVEPPYLFPDGHAAAAWLAAPDDARAEEYGGVAAPRMAVPDRRKVSKFGQWLGRWMQR